MYYVKDISWKLSNVWEKELINFKIDSTCDCIVRFKLQHIYINIEILSTHRSKFQCLYTYARISKKKKINHVWYFRLYKKRLQVNRKLLILWLSVLRPCFSQLRTTEWPHSSLSSAHAIQASLPLQRSVSRTLSSMIHKTLTWVKQKCVLWARLQTLCEYIWISITFQLL